MTTHATDRFQREQLEAQHAPAVELEASVGGATGARVQREGNEVLKVSAHSRPNAVAGAIANIVRHQGAVEIQSVGAGATNHEIAVRLVVGESTVRTHIQHLQEKLGFDNRNQLTLYAVRIGLVPNTTG